jgi:hypothetical protein
MKSLERNIFSGEITALIPLREELVMWFKIEGSRNRYDLEARFPVRVEGRHRLHEGKRIRVGLWEPRIMLFAD